MVRHRPCRRTGQPAPLRRGGRVQATRSGQDESVGSGAGVSGGAGLRTALWLALGGWAGCVLLQLALYLRPAPHGGPFLIEWPRYFGLALYYDLLGTWLLSLPFLL